MIPRTPLALANSRKSERDMNLPLFLKAGFRTSPEELRKGLVI